MEYKWWQKGVVYQIYPRSFLDINGDGIGDIKGITQKVDYIKGLGADIVWLSPIFASPNDDNGYDISDYRNIMKEFGTMEDFNEMSQALHDAGIKLVLDLVVNHTSDEHAWFAESRAGNDKYKDYYIWRPAKSGGGYPNNWTSFFTGPAWKYDEQRKEYYLHLFSEKQPDLNWDNPDVRQEVKDIVKFWLDKGVDGFRCDVINLISKPEDLPDGAGKKDLVGIEHYVNGPHVHKYLNELYNDVLSKYDCFTVGEMGVSAGDAEKFIAPERDELSMIISFDHMNADCKQNKWFPRKFNLEKFKKACADWQNINGWVALYLENHDQRRVVSRYGDEGKYRRQSAKSIATAMYLMKGTPFVYQGQEIGMTNAHMKKLSDYRDVETLNVYKIGRKRHFPRFVLMKRIRNISRDNVRTPMQWSTSENAGFSPVTPWIKVNENYKEINVKNELSAPDSIYRYFASLFALRRKYPVFIGGEFTHLYSDDNNVFSYKREDEKHTAFIIANFKNKIVSMKPYDLSEYSLVLCNYDGMQEDGVLRPYESRVYIRYNIG